MSYIELYRNLLEHASDDYRPDSKVLLPGRKPSQGPKFTLPALREAVA